MVLNLPGGLGIFFLFTFGNLNRCNNIIELLYIRLYKFIIRSLSGL